VVICSVASVCQSVSSVNLSVNLVTYTAHNRKKPSNALYGLPSCLVCISYTSRICGSRSIRTRSSWFTVSVFFKSLYSHDIACYSTCNYSERQTAAHWPRSVNQLTMSSKQLHVQNIFQFNERRLKATFVRATQSACTRQVVKLTSALFT